MKSNYLNKNFLTAINNLNAWRLGSIEENDHETIV